MTQQPRGGPAARRAASALGTVLGVVGVVGLEFGLLTAVYHSGDPAIARVQAWSQLRGAESGWTPGAPTAAVRGAVAALDDQAGSRARAVDLAAAAWAADPDAARFASLRQATTTLGERLARDRAHADRRAMWIHAGLLVVASIGWFFWFRRVVRRQRQMQSSLTQARVAMAGERRLTALVRNSVDVVMVVDPDLTVSFASPSTVGVLGRRPDDLLGVAVETLVVADDAALLTGMLANSGAGEHTLLLHAPHADGRELVLEGTLTNLLADDTVNGWVLTVRDVTERLALRDELAHQALHDTLTGLPNRQLFIERLSFVLRPRSGALRPLVVLFLDLDDFKHVNDSLGHAIGDDLLRQFAARVSATVRQGDTVARLGGDEFAVLMEDSEPATAEALATRLARTLAGPMRAGDGEVSVRSSIGLAAAHPGEATAEEALRDAEVAMHFAKQRGKDRVAVYDAELHATGRRRLQVRSQLGEAIEDDQLVLHFQPVYLLQTGAVDGFEALVRWEHPTDGLRFPDEFIEIAEQSGLIVPLGRWVLRQACRITAEQLSVGASDPVIAVNVSPLQLCEPGFHEEVVQVLADTGLHPTRLVLEITETALLEDRRAVVGTLEALTRIGVQIAIDDFGTGYSSLSYLADLPAQILKIDRSFVSGIGQGSESLVEAIIAMGQSLDMVTLAEGVEEVEQADWLRAAGCQVGQGYLWARPLPLPEARAVLLAAARSAEAAVVSAG